MQVNFCKDNFLTHPGDMLPKPLAIIEICLKLELLTFGIYLIFALLSFEIFNTKHQNTDKNKFSFH